MSMPALVRLALAFIVVSAALIALATEVNPEGMLFFIAFIAAGVLVSFADRERFWPQPPRKR